MDRHVFKVNKQYLVCDRHEKKFVEGVFSKNIWEGASERRNENIILSGTLKILKFFKLVKNYY